MDRSIDRSIKTSIKHLESKSQAIFWITRRHISRCNKLLPRSTRCAQRSWLRVILNTKIDRSIDRSILDTNLLPVLRFSSGFEEPQSSTKMNESIDRSMDGSIDRLTQTHWGKTGFSKIDRSIDRSAPAHIPLQQTFTSFYPLCTKKLA